jgi:hypothetical protein
LYGTIISAIKEELMDKKIAQHVAKTAFRASADLGSVIPLLKEHCSTEEYEKLRLPIATVSASIGLDILNLIFEYFPDIKQEFDEDIKLYGKIL